MKKLYLVRHAKSSWDDPNLSDFERPLNERGLRDAPYMAKLLKGIIGNADILISSPANRAISTAIIFAEKLNQTEKSILKDERIYEAALTDLYAVLQEVSEKYKSVLLFGHNPGISYLAEILTTDFRLNMPTCCVVGIELWIDDWTQISKGIGKVILHEWPKKYLD